jgi:RNA polymerase subunit RPABC4/transcription elongation factor Spt4
MIKSARSVTRSVHWPLRRLALCLDCDECFELGPNCCPACSSETWTTLARFLEIVSPERAPRSAIRTADRPTPSEPADQRQEGRHLLIVARDRILLYEQLRRAFAGNQSVQVLLDRRHRERRQGKGQPATERRRGDRRARRGIDAQLRAIGWSLVLLDLNKPRSRAIR